jgi:hypothetical protein
MSITDRHRLLADQNFLRGQLANMPESARLTRMSTQARLRVVEAELAELPELAREPARARLTFNGAPVVGSQGIFADFSMRAVSSFTDAVATVAASLTAPLAAMGPIPNRDQNQLLITDTAVGSFGFELEEYQGQQARLIQHTSVAVALERTQALLHSTMSDDDELADVASETDPRALDKVRSFLRVLADSEAVCTLEVAARTVRFADVGQVRHSLQRLGADNLREAQAQLAGQFMGLLPQSRTFEFRLAADGQTVRGKVAPAVEGVDSVNQHLNQAVQIDVMTTQVGNDRPRYLLTRLPEWPTLIGSDALGNE